MMLIAGRPSLRAKFWLRPPDGPWYMAALQGRSASDHQCQSLQWTGAIAWRMVGIVLPAKNHHKGDEIIDLPRCRNLSVQSYGRWNICLNTMDWHGCCNSGCAVKSQSRSSMRPATSESGAAQRHIDHGTRRYRLSHRGLMLLASVCRNDPE